MPEMTLAQMGIPNPAIMVPIPDFVQGPVRYPRLLQVDVQEYNPACLYVELRMTEIPIEKIEEDGTIVRLPEDRFPLVKKRLLADNATLVHPETGQKLLLDVPLGTPEEEIDARYGQVGGPLHDGEKTILWVRQGNFFRRLATQPLQVSIDFLIRSEVTDKYASEGRVPAWGDPVAAVSGPETTADEPTPAP